MITTYGLNKWAKRAIGQVDETLHSYKTLSEGPLRRLLHLRDLRHPLVLELFTSQEKKLLNNLFLKAALEPKIFRGASKLLGEKIFREIYRAKA